MQTAMEILSRLNPQTGFGEGVRKRTFSGDPGNVRFEQIFTNAQAEAPPVSKADTATEEKSDDPEKADKPQGADAPQSADAAQKADPSAEDTEDEANAAGVMGTPDKVIFILEGDKESGTTPAAPAVETDMPETAEIVSAADLPEAETEPAAQTEQGEPSYADEMYRADETAKAAAPVKPAGATAQGAESEADAVETGEVTARMPEVIRTSEQSGAGNEPEQAFSGNGDLSPLENENDKAPAEGKEEKTYSETVKTAQNTESGTAPAPLAAGIEPERLNAAEQMKQAPLNAPVRQENLFDEMVQRLEMMQTEDQSRMTIQLKPSFLGDVTLQLAMDAAGMHIKISAADQAVRGMINGQISALVESLENKGIAVSEVEVTYTGVDNGLLMSSRESRHARPGNLKRTQAEENADGAEYYAAITSETLEHYLDMGVSTVEYRA